MKWAPVRCAFTAGKLAEKLLKAYLISRNVEFGRTKIMRYLLDLCAGQDPQFKQVDMGNLNFYAVEIRYPDEFYVPSAAEARECFETAAKINELVLAKLNVPPETA